MKYTIFLFMNPHKVCVVPTERRVLEPRWGRDNHSEKMITTSDELTPLLRRYAQLEGCALPTTPRTVGSTNFD